MYRQICSMCMMLFLSPKMRMPMTMRNRMAVRCSIMRMYNRMCMQMFMVQTIDKLPNALILLNSYFIYINFLSAMVK